MESLPLFRKINLSIGLVILFIVVLSLAVGVSSVINGSPFTPLIFGLAIFSAILLVTLINKPEWALYVAIVAIFIPSDLLEHLPITFLANYLVTFILLFAVLTWIIAVIRNRRAIFWKGTISFLLLFIFWNIISFIWAPNLSLARQMLVTILNGFLLLVLIVNQIDSIKSLNKLMEVLAVIGCLLVAAGVTKLLLEGYSEGVRLNILGINENQFGVDLLLVTPGVLWTAVKQNKRPHIIAKLLTLIYLILSMGLIAMSGSRGSAISLLITIVLFCLWKPTRFWGLAGIIVMIMGLIFAPLLFSTTLERFAITPGDTLLGGREVLWQAAWNMIRDHFWLGVGIGNARQGLLYYLMMMKNMIGYDSAAAHNPILQVWAEVGIPGLLLYLGSLVSAVTLFIKKYFLNRRLRKTVITPYFAIISSVFIGYMASWIKGGGIEFDFSYFMMLGLLLLPESIKTEDSHESLK